jgi:hypothetical protein
MDKETSRYGKRLTTTDAAGYRYVCHNNSLANTISSSDTNWVETVLRYSLDRALNQLTSRKLMSYFNEGWCFRVGLALYRIDKRDKAGMLIKCNVYKMGTLLFGCTYLRSPCCTFL